MTNVILRLYAITVVIILLINVCLFVFILKNI